MARTLQIGTRLYPFPETGDRNWGQDVYNWAQAITNTVNEGGGGGGGTTFTTGTGLILANDVLSIADGGVDTDQLADEAVTASKIAQSSITQNKLSNGAVSADKIGVNAVTEEKLNITNTGVAGQVLSYAGSNNFTWVAASEAGVEDLSGVRGGSGITVTHTQSNEIATVAVNESIQNRLIPTGGTANQFLTRQSDDPNTFDWTTLQAGQGLLLENGTFTIPDYAITSKLLDQDIGSFIFQTPLRNSEDIELSGLDNVHIVRRGEPHAPQFIIFPRDSSRSAYTLDTSGDVSEFSVDYTGASPEFGVAIRNDFGGLVYVPILDGNALTRLRPYAGNAQQSQLDIILKTRITGLNSQNTSLTYNELHKFFYFSDGDSIYSISLDGDVTIHNIDIFHREVIESMGSYICVYDQNYSGGRQTYNLYSIIDSSGRLRTRSDIEFHLARPKNITTGYNHYNIIKSGFRFYSLVGFAEGLTEAYKLVEFYAGNGPFDVHTSDLPANQFVPPGGTTGQILAKISDHDYNDGWIDPPSIEIDDGTLGPDKLNISNPALKGNRAIPAFSSDTQFQYLQAATLPQFFSDHSIHFNKLYEATHYVDNGGSIDPREGDYNMALVYKKQTGIGSPNEEWVPANLDEIFNLNAVQIVNHNHVSY